VPQSQEKSRESNQNLPNPELNPLLNPTLGNNLGRWAQAYFTSPPEKREEAVLELLRELEAESGGEESTSGSSATQAKWSNAAEGSQLNPSLTCAECGHENAPRQKFCGMCGSRLVFPDTGGETPETLAREIRNTAPVERPPVMSQPAEPLQVPSFGGLSLFATVNPSASELTPGSSDTDIQWLREKSYETEEESRGSATKYLVTALGLLLLGVLFYAQWKPQATRPRASNSAPSATHAAPATQPSEPASGSPAADQHHSSPDQPAASAPETAAPSESPASNPRVQNATPAATAHTAANSPAGDKAPTAVEPPKEADSGPVFSASSVQSEKPNQPEGAASSEGANSSAGATELAAAESFLSGKYGTRDSSQAAKLLWRAVGKENTTAILLLSNLYLTGDGVSKSCDQAKMLLRAAAQKNSSEAANKLRELQRSGCP
jgi:hypothetical protein